MKRLAILLLTLAGCVTPSTRIDIVRDPTTGAISARLERGWLAGPVDIEGEYQAPDGTRVRFRWSADVDLDPAAAVAEAREANLAKALELAGAAAKVGAVP